MLWTDGYGVLANCFLCGTEATLAFSAGPVCSSFSAGACHSARSLLVSAAPRNLPFLFSSYLTLALFLPPCPRLHLSFYLKLSGRSVFSFLLFYQVTMVPEHSLLPGNDAADELARLGALLAPSAIPCSLSPLISRIHSCLFSDWRRTVSSKFFDTQVPSIANLELVLPSHARYVFSRLRCNGHSLPLSFYLSRIGRIENPSFSVCGHLSQDTSHLILHCPATDSLRRTLFGDSLSTISGPDPGELLGFWGSMVFYHAPIPRKGSGNQLQQQA